MPTLRPPSENALLEALRRAAKSEDSSDGQTGPELARLLNWGGSRVQAVLRTLLEQGIVEVCVLTRQRIDGIQTRLNGYRLKDPGAKRGPSRG